MHPSTSIFLDLLRFSAACVVFFSHVTAREFNAVWPWVRWGHEAVVVFFVMSGFVIAHVIQGREGDAREFAAARLGRLYSVVLPALLLTALLDPFGRQAAPALYADVPADHPALRLLINGLFLQQNWNLTVMPLSNGPFWSLGYEFWYYLIFGTAMFARGRARHVLPVLLCLGAGPRIVAHFPLWLLGVLAYRLDRNWQPAARRRLLLLVGCGAALLAILTFGNPLAPLRHGLAAAYPDNRIYLAGLPIFLGDIPKLPEDLLVGALMGLLITSVRAGAGALARWPRSVAAIRYLAGSTFTLYLFHVPLLYFFTATLAPKPGSALHTGLVAVLVFACCLALSHAGERRVGQYRQVFRRLLGASHKATPAAPAAPSG